VARVPSSSAVRLPRDDRRLRIALDQQRAEGSTLPCGLKPDQRLTNDTPQPNKNKRRQTLSNVTLIIRLFRLFRGPSVTSELDRSHASTADWRSRQKPAAMSMLQCSNRYRRGAEICDKVKL
jgi:hypothetical protein